MRVCGEDFEEERERETHEPETNPWLQDSPQLLLECSRTIFLMEIVAARPLDESASWFCQIGRNMHSFLVKVFKNHFSDR